MVKQLIHMKAEGKYNTSNHTRHTWMSLCEKLETGDQISDHIDMVDCLECKTIHKHFCPSCGNHFAMHNDDGSCIEE
jgi:rRNA maturation endonuclease Nob1